MRLRRSERAGWEICGTSEQSGEILLHSRSLFAQFAFYLAARSLDGLQLGRTGGGQQRFGVKQAGVRQILGQLVTAKELAVVEPVGSFGKRVARFRVESNGALKRMSRSGRGVSFFPQI
jgi:hypothetical protein